MMCRLAACKHGIITAKLHGRLLSVCLVLWVIVRTPVYICTSAQNPM